MDVKWAPYPGVGRTNLNLSFLQHPYSDVVPKSSNPFSLALSLSRCKQACRNPSPSINKGIVLMGRIQSIVQRIRNIPLQNIALESAQKSFLVAKFLCLCHVTNNYVFSIAQVYGPSMLPTINLTSDRVLVERISHRIGQVGLGDIVIVRSPENPTKTVTKRITGVEGDTITYAVDPSQGDQWKTVIVPKGHVWVQGDNVFASKDSRNFGPVPYALIQAKALIRVGLEHKEMYRDITISIYRLPEGGWRVPVPHSYLHDMED